MSQSLLHDWFPRSLPANVRLEPGSWLYSSFALIHYRSQRPLGLRIGSDTGVFNGTFFELGINGEVDIGDSCSIVGAILNTNGRIEFGDYCLVAHEVVFADDEIAIPPDVRRDAASEHYSPLTSIGPNVWVGARAFIRTGIEVGEGAIVGAGAVVTESVPAFAIVAGNPARVVGSCSKTAGGRGSENA